MAHYEYLTLLDFRTAILKRLKDETGTFWPVNEIDVYIREALRVYGAFSFSQKVDTVLNLVQNTAYYDLKTNTALNTIAIKAQDLLAEINAHLVESSDSTATITSDVQYQTELLKALEHRRNLFLEETGRIIESNLYLIGAGNELNLPNLTGDIFRVSFIDFDGKEHLLSEDKERTLSSFDTDSKHNNGIPKYYVLLDNPDSKLVIYPTPNQAGYLRLFHVSYSGLVNLSGMDIPTNLAWVVKYGALADIYSQDGIQFDPNRAKYCLERWNQGITLAKNYPSVLYAVINSQTIEPTFFSALDDFSPNWMNEARKPSLFAMMGWNKLLIEKPDDDYNIVLRVLGNVPVPTTDNEFVKIPRDSISYITNYVLHIAMLKVGGESFNATLEKFQQFMEHALKDNEYINKGEFVFKEEKADAK